MTAAPDPAPIRVLLIGTGFGATVHAPGFAGDPRFRLVGIASGRRENAEATAKTFGVGYATDDWKRMLDDVDADLVSIVTPADLHYPMARAALERKRHVLCEKPFAMNVAQAKELAALARAQGVVNVVNHEFRHQPARAAMTRLLAEGALGALEHVAIADRIPGWARNPSRRLTWLTERDRGGGYLGALGSHHLDTLILWGGPIRRVFCRLRSLAATAPGADAAHRAITSDDTFTLLVEFRSGATAIVDLFGGAHARRGRFEVFGARDALAIEGERSLIRPRADGGDEPLAIPADLDHEPTPDAALLGPFRVVVSLLAGAIREGKAASPTFADGVEIQKALDAARLSDRTGEWVEIEE
ncbi:MAG: Gfo/Idh/MocA family protein [Hyphomicrobiales bacterium]